MRKLTELDTLTRKLKKKGIILEYALNFPWVYLIKINSQSVHEKRDSEHGYTIGLLPVSEDRPFFLLELAPTFKLIRKYLNTMRKLNGKKN